MVADDTEQAIFNLIEDYNSYWFWLGKRYPLKKETDINADFKMAPEDAAELLEVYAERFGINPADINFDKYFLLFPHQPLTIEMLIESAKVKQWLY